MYKICFMVAAIMMLGIVSVSQVQAYTAETLHYSRPLYGEGYHKLQR